MSHLTFGLGWNRPLPAHYARCRPGVHAAELLADVVPAESSDNSDLVTIINQGLLGSCTANAWMQIIHGAMVAAGLDPSTEFGSRLMAYYLARCEDGNQTVDSGTQICTVADACCRIGFCKESAWPYDPAWFASMPPPEAFREAFDQRGQIDINYHRLDGVVEGDDLLDLIRRALTARYLVTWGTLVSKAFCSGELGFDPIKPPTDQPIAGGHAQVICGHNGRPDGQPSFRDVNSWGPEFGDGGFCDVAPEYVSWSASSDMWICKVAPRFSSPRFSGGTP